jgi:hypothetical protein
VDRIDDLDQRLSLRGQLTGGAFGAQSDCGQRLADLVVQLAGDPQPLGLLSGEGAVGAIASLGLDPVEARWPGCIGSIWPIRVARRRNGDITSISSTKSTASVTTSPTTSAVSSLSLIGLETVAGLAIKTNTASPKTIALTVKTLHRIEIVAGPRRTLG